jgi:hypothetical protein
VSASERDLQEELARLDASITVLERVDALSERARADLDSERARRAELTRALEALRGARER